MFDERPLATPGRGPEVGLTIFVVAMLVAGLYFPGEENVPFHVAYVAVTLFYGVRLWPLRRAIEVLISLAIVTAALGVLALAQGQERTEDLYEIPLLSAMFGIMILHVESRQRAAVRLAALADDRARILHRERRMVQNASHELLTPLTVIRSRMELLGRRAPPTETELGRARSIILNEAERMQRMISDLLALGRLEGDDAEERSRVAVSQLVEPSWRRFRAFPERDWELFDESGDAAVVVSVDDVESAIDALLDNAYRYSGAGDAITVRLVATADAVEIAISDTGIGVPEADLPHVFDRFFRAETTRHDTAGTGLGLAIVAAVAGAHGGDVAIASIEGEGTRIALRLPRTGTRPPPP